MEQMKGYYAGINFGGWFSQCDYSLDRYDNFIKEKDFEIVKIWGFDHVRIPVDYNLFQDQDGSFIESGFDRIERVIEYCKKNDLNMILDLHKTLGFSFDKGEKEEGLFEDVKYQDNFCLLWQQLAKRFSKYSDMLAFELLNEVTKKEYMPLWNKLASKVIEIIRGYSKDIKILIGGYYNNSVEAVTSIDVPIDSNIVFNFHCYEPLLFTHQGAYWIDTMDTSFRFDYKSDMTQYKQAMDVQLKNHPALYNPRGGNQAPDPEFFKAMFKEAVEFAKEKGVGIYCGEYGVIDLASTEDTLKWYRDIHSAFNEYGIGHALWSYKEMDFEFCGDRMSQIREEIISTSKQEK